MRSRIRRLEEQVDELHSHVATLRYQLAFSGVRDARLRECLEELLKRAHAREEEERRTT
jgi:hypothetical protein